VSVEQLAAIDQVHNLFEAHHVGYWPALGQAANTESRAE
jgi:hypothetical protein